MTKDEIIKLAREAGFERVVAIHPDGSKTVTVELEAFANLVAKHERKACAIVAENKEAWYDDSRGIAKAIRARGQA